jgi:hypothetical protein
MGFIAYVCVTFVIETMSASNAFLKKGPEEPQPTEANQEDESTPLNAKYVEHTQFNMIDSQTLTKHRNPFLQQIKHH